MNSWKGKKHDKAIARTLLIHAWCCRTGKLQIGETVTVVNAPCTVIVPGDKPHAMTPVTDYVVLKYSFKTGPFESVVYHYSGQYIENEPASKL